MSRENNPNIIHRMFDGGPIQLRWGAWVSDTYLLKREGWEFAAEQHYDLYHNAFAVRLAVTSPDKYAVIAGVFYIRPCVDDRRHYGVMDFNEFHNGRPVEMQHYTAKDAFRTIHMDEMNSWLGLKPVDIMDPTFTKTHDMRMRDFKFFKELEGSSQNEIYIPPNSVDALFNEILKIQYPEQQEIKKGLIMPSAKPLIKATIFTLAV